MAVFPYSWAFSVDIVEKEHKDKVMWLLGFTECKRKKKELTNLKSWGIYLKKKAQDNSSVKI